ncbi:MAG: TonB-dependent receptor [Myxococcota bacterium]|nr:TonB-dependent receptor [Myxococcota bacterium]
MTLAPAARARAQRRTRSLSLEILLLALLLALALAPGALAATDEPLPSTAGPDDEPVAGSDAADPLLGVDEPTIRTPEVEITSTRFARELLDTPGNATIIDREKIDESGARDLPDLLRREAGLYVTNTTTNREGNTVEARGFNNGGGNGGRTLVLVDGRRVNEEDSGQVDWSFLTLDNVDRVEIIRGPTSAAYGDNAIAGVIHIRTLHPDSDGVEATVRGRMGTYDTHQTSALAKGRHGPVSISAFFDFDSTDAYRERADFRGKTSEMDIRFRIGDRGSVGIKGGYGSTKRLRPGDLTQAQFEADRRQAEPGTGDNFDLARQRFVQGRVEYAFNEVVSLDIQGHHRRRTDDTRINDPFTEFIADSEKDSLGLKTQFQLDFEILGMRNRFLFGGDLLQEDVDNGSVFTIFDDFFGDSEFPSRSSSRRKLWGIFVHNETHLTDDLILSLGARRDESTYKATDRIAGMRFETAHAEWAPRAAINWRVCEEASVYASYSRGFRFPNQDEAFGFFGFQPGLVPETSDSYEFGGKFRSERGSLNVSVYQMNVRDEIFFNPEALNPFFLPFQVTGVNVNIDRVRHRGIEVSGSVRPVDWLEIFGSYTLDDVKIRRDTQTGLVGSRLPITPRHRGHGGVRVYLPFGFELSGHARLVGSRYVGNDIANEIEKLTAYTSYDARAAWRHDFQEWLSFEVEGIAYNLTDREYNDFAARSTFTQTVGFFPSPERHYVVGVRITVRR